MSIVIPSQPIIFSAPTGNSQLPIVEIAKAKVTQKRTSVRLRQGSKKRADADCSYGDYFGSPLHFSAWGFFHAAKKTELARSFTATLAERRAFAFALEHEDTFHWNTNNFRKVDSSVFALEDFGESGLAGRVGEAIAYLTMQKWGYIYWDRCATVWERAARNANITHAEMLRVVQFLSSNSKPINEPDFIFEKQNGEVALMEAKGGFVKPGTDYPQTKAVLNKALIQLAAWSNVLVPTPAKAYGICTLLREQTDTHEDSSLITFVDPPGEQAEDLQPAELPPDLIRRCHYGAWLFGMGLMAAGTALRNRQTKIQEEVVLPTIQIGTHRYAFTITGWENINPAFLSLMRWSPLQSHWLVMGTDTNILRSIEKAIQNLEGTDLLDIETMEQDGNGLISNKLQGSIMPDGTMICFLNGDQLRESSRSLEAFQL